MKIFLYLFFALMLVVVAGCEEPQASQVNSRDGVKSSSLSNNIVTRPVAYAFSGLIGEGIEITDANTIRSDTGFLELHVKGYNRSQGTKKFWYKVEWLDKSNSLIQSKTSVWLPESVMGKSMGAPHFFEIKAVAPTPDAVDFRIETKKWE